MSEVDLEQIPFLTHYPEDGGAYASSAVVFINDPADGPQRLLSPAAAAGQDRVAARLVERRGTETAWRNSGRRHPRRHLHRPAAARAAGRVDGAGARAWTK